MLRWLACCALPALGCYDFDALSSKYNISGAYSVNVTNGTNGCNFANWMVGVVANNIPLQVTQNGSNVVAQVDGLPGTFLNLWLGTNVFTGTLDRGDLNLVANGRMKSDRTCNFTIRATATGHAENDLIMGMIDYTAQTNGSVDCTTPQGCHTYQSFNGARPPTR